MELRRDSVIGKPLTELRGLRAQILHLRAACLKLNLDDTVSAFIDGLRNLLRRATLTLVEARAVLARLTSVISGHSTGTPIAAPEDVSASFADHSQSDGDDRLPAPASTSEVSAHGTITPAPDDPAPAKAAETIIFATNKTPTSAGQDVRHIEPESDTKKKKASPRRSTPLVGPDRGQQLL